MKAVNVLQLAVVATVALAFGPVYGQDADGTAAVTNVVAAPVNLPANAAEVVKLSKAGLGDDVVLAYVKSGRSLYNLSASQIVQLKSNGVSPTVITAMLNHDSTLNAAATASLQPPTPPAPTMNPEPPAPQAPAAPEMISTAPASAPPQPAAPVEVITVSPGPDYYWTPGYYGWNNGWVWIGGGWGLRGGYYWGHGWRGYGYGYRGGYHYHR